MKKLFHASFRAGVLLPKCNITSVSVMLVFGQTKRDLILRELVKEPVPELGYTANVMSAVRSSSEGHYSLLLQCIITTSRGQIH